MQGGERNSVPLKSAVIEGLTIPQYRAFFQKELRLTYIVLFMFVYTLNMYSYLSIDDLSIMGSLPRLSFVYLPTSMLTQLLLFK